MERIAYREVAGLTTWRVGPKSVSVLSPRSPADLIALLRLNVGREFHVLGAGSNTLLTDDAGGVPILSTKRLDRNIEVDISSGRVLAGGSAMLPTLAREAAVAGISGFEMYAGIPGTVGGALIMNAGIGGSDGPCTVDILKWVEVVDFDSGDTLRLPADEIRFGYRRCSLAEMNALVVSAMFQGVPSGDSARVVERTQMRLDDRKRKQPIGKRTAGSMYLPVGGVAAGVLIDSCGLRGVSVGGACVSQRHANWIETSAEATAGDVLQLIDQTRAAVRQRFRVDLQLEVHMLPGTANRVVPRLPTS